MVECIKYIVAIGIASLSIYNKVYKGLLLCARKLMGTGGQFSIGGTRDVQTYLVFDYAIRRIGSDRVEATFSLAVGDVILTRDEVQPARDAVRKEFRFSFRGRSSAIVDGCYNLELVDARLIECKTSWFLPYKIIVRVGNEYISARELLYKNDIAKIRLLHDPRRSLKNFIDYVRHGILHGSGE